MTSLKYVEDFHNICRLCTMNANEINPLFPLFLHHGLYGRLDKNTRESIPDALTMLTGLKVCKHLIYKNTIHNNKIIKAEPSDGLPQSICMDCEQQLIRSNAFLNQCLKSYNILQNIKSQTNGLVEESVSMDLVGFLF